MKLKIWVWLRGLCIVSACLALTSCGIGLRLGPSGASNASYMHYYALNGGVSAAALSTDAKTLYVGGAFTAIQQVTGAAVMVDTSFGLGSQTIPPPYVNGSAFAIAVDPASPGAWYIGGQFTQVNGIARSNVAHILSNGAVDPNWNPIVNGPVQALAVASNGVYLGGSFTSVGGTTRNNAASVDPVTGTLSSWNPNVNGTVAALAVTSNSVYLGGAFTSVGATSTRNNAASV